MNGFLESFFLAIASAFQETFLLPIFPSLPVRFHSIINSQAKPQLRKRFFVRAKLDLWPASFFRDLSLSRSRTKYVHVYDVLLRVGEAASHCGPQEDVEAVEGAKDIQQRDVIFECCSNVGWRGRWRFNSSQQIAQHRSGAVFRTSRVGSPDRGLAVYS